MLQECIEQRVGAAVRAVLAAVFAERVAHCVVDVGAGQEIRNADGKTDDVAAGGFELLGLVGHDHDRARLGAAHARSESQHGSPRRIAGSSIGPRIEHAALAKPFNSNTASSRLRDGAKALALPASNAQTSSTRAAPRDPRRLAHPTTE